MAVAVTIYAMCTVPQLCLDLDQPRLFRDMLQLAGPESSSIQQRLDQRWQLCVFVSHIAATGR